MHADFMHVYFCGLFRIAAYKLVGSSSFFPSFAVSTSGSALSLSRYFIKLIVGVQRYVVRKSTCVNTRIYNICTFHRYCKIKIKYCIIKIVKHAHTHTHSYIYSSVLFHKNIIYMTILYR